MIQGGDPTGTGRGGTSMWGSNFRDEFDSRLTHEGRGVLSMANSGKDTNGSQFFITFRSCHHLDNKHAVFGRVVGGATTLDKMESIRVDNNDKPIGSDITIDSCEVFVDPYEELRIENEREEQEKINKKNNSQAEHRPSILPAPALIRPQVHDHEDSFSTPVGKYLNLPQKVSSTTAAYKRKSNSETPDDKPHLAKKQFTAKSGAAGFGNFDGW